MAQESPERCDNCRFFGPNDDSDAGLCRRRAPVPRRELVDADGLIDPHWANWPLVYVEDWCGEHEPKVGPKAENKTP